MKLARVLLLISMAAGLGAQTTPTWDTSGNGLLNGTYYFRYVIYVLSNAGTGQLYDTASRVYRNPPPSAAAMAPAPMP